MVAVHCDPEVMRVIPGGALDGIEAVKTELARHADALAARGLGSWAVWHGRGEHTGHARMKWGNESR
jgi:hypothetical protein